jgi:hypothetical protein
MKGKYNGPEYDPEIDEGRLDNQHARVKRAMLDRRWHTLAEIAVLTGDPPASISAQLRHLRKPRFGSWIVNRRPRGDRANGLFEYRLLPAELDGAEATPRVTLRQQNAALRDQVEELEEENAFLYKRIQQLEQDDQNDA